MPQRFPCSSSFAHEFDESLFTFFTAFAAASLSLFHLAALSIAFLIAGNGLLALAGALWFLVLRLL